MIVNGKGLQALLACVALAACSASDDGAEPEGPADAPAPGPGAAPPKPPTPAVPGAVVPADKTAHAFFEEQCARPSRLGCWPLRSQQNIDSVTGANAGNSSFRYVWPSDTYADKQDAAKFVHGPNSLDRGSESISIGDQLRMPIGISSGKILVTWDFYYGPEFRDNIGEVGAHKEFQIREGDAIYFETRNLFRRAPTPTDLSAVDVRAYSSPIGADPTGVLRSESFSPAGPATHPMYPIKVARWTRYWAEVRLGVPGAQFTEWSKDVLGGSPLTGTWTMLSLWVADEDRDPVRILYRVPWRPRTSSITDFDFEFNTSSPAGSQTGALVGYGRNVVVLRDFDADENDPTLFRRPKR